MLEKEAFSRDCVVVARKCKGSGCMAWLGKKEGNCAIVDSILENSLPLVEHDYNLKDGLVAPEPEEIKQGAKDIKKEQTFTSLGDNDENDYAKV